MDQVSLDNCEKMHKRYEKDYMEKAGGNIRNTSCLRNHTTRTRRKKRPQIHAIFLHMEQMSGIEPPCPPWQGGVLPLNYICTRMAVRTRIELAISSVTGRHVSHYTTEPLEWRRRRDLNPRAGNPDLCP